jgi:hypothetical protein
MAAFAKGWRGNDRLRSASLEGNRAAILLHRHGEIYVVTQSGIGAWRQKGIAIENRRKPCVQILETYQY